VPINITLLNPFEDRNAGELGAVAPTEMYLRPAPSSRD